MDNCWLSCQVMADMKKVYDNLIIVNLYLQGVHWKLFTWADSLYSKQSAQSTIIK